MTGTATTTGQEPSQPGNGSGSASTSGNESTTTLLGGDPNAAPAGDGKAAQGAAGDKPAGDTAAKPGEGEGKKPDDKSTEAKDKAGTPEPYTDFTMPEGIEVDAELVSAATPVLRELKLDQAGAQKLVDVFAQHQMKLGEAYNEQLKDPNFALTQVGAVLANQSETWSAALKTDKEIGGKDFEANSKVAMRAIARFGSPELKTLLNQTKLGNNPEFVRFCLKVGRSISEDSTTLGGAAKSGRKSNEDVFYSGEQAAS